MTFYCGRPWHQAAVINSSMARHDDTSSFNLTAQMLHPLAAFVIVFTTMEHQFKKIFLLFHQNINLLSPFFPLWVLMNSSEALGESSRHYSPDNTVQVMILCPSWCATLIHTVSWTIKQSTSEICPFIHLHNLHHTGYMQQVKLESLLKWSKAYLT